MIATADNYVKSANFKVLKILKFHIRKVNMSTFRHVGFKCKYCA